MVQSRAYSRCPYCGEFVWFPYPTRQEQAEDQHRIPMGTWQAEILCTACGQMWLCKALSLHLGIPRTSGRGQSALDDAFFEIVFECGEQNCGLPIRAYVHTTKHLLPETARDLLLRAKLKPRCAAGHLLSDNCKCVLAREVFSLWP